MDESKYLNFKIIIPDTWSKSSVGLVLANASSLSLRNNSRTSGTAMIHM